MYTKCSMEYLRLDMSHKPLGNIISVALDDNILPKDSWMKQLINDKSVKSCTFTSFT